jgi:hypothetical protein
MQESNNAMQCLDLRCVRRCVGAIGSALTAWPPSQLINRCVGLALCERCALMLYSHRYVRECSCHERASR